MANLLTSGLAYNPFFYVNSGLRVLYNRLGMAFYVLRDLAAGKASGTGDTIQVRRAQTFGVQTMPIAVASFADVSPMYDNVVISEWKGNGFKLTDKEKTLTPAAFVRDHIGPVAVGIANQIDSDLAGLGMEVPWIVDDDATDPYKDFPAIRKMLFDNKAPDVSPSEYAYQTDGVLQQRYESNPTFVQAQSDADAGQLQRSGQLGVKFGFRIFPNQNSTNAVTGTAGATFTVNGVNAKNSATLSLTVGTPAGTFRRGTVLSIAGQSQKYAIRADIAAAATTVVSISPVLANATAGGEAVTLDQTASTSTGLAFHREAFALVMQELEPAGPGIESASVRDEITNLSLRARIGADFGLGVTVWALDALWAFKALNPNLAVRLRI